MLPTPRRCLARTALARAAFALAWVAPACLAADPPFTLAYAYHLPTPPPPDAGAVTIVAADFTLDNRVDVAVAFGGVPVMLFVAQLPARGGFQPKPLSALHGYSTGLLDRTTLAAGPPNDTGQVRELVYATSSHGARRLRWIGGLANYADAGDTIELPPVDGAVGRIASIAAGDFDGDGRSDVAIADVPSDASRDLRTGAVVAWGRAGQSVVERALPTVADPYYLAVADFTGDAARASDLLVANRYRDVGLVTFDAGTQRLVLARSLLLPLAVAINGMAAGDLDGDGRPDALVNYRTGAGNSLDVVIENRGAQGLALGRSLAFGYALAQCIGDFDGDGKADVLVDGRQLQLGRGDWRFEPTPAVIAEDTYGLACADFNRDGYLDFAVATAGPGSTLELRVYTFREHWDRIFASDFGGGAPTR